MSLMKEKKEVNTHSQFTNTTENNEAFEKADSDLCVLGSVW